MAQPPAGLPQREFRGLKGVQSISFLAGALIDRLVLWDVGKLLHQ